MAKNRLDVIPIQLNLQSCNLKIRLQNCFTDFMSVVHLFLFPLKTFAIQRGLIVHVGNLQCQTLFQNPRRTLQGPKSKVFQ